MSEIAFAFDWFVLVRSCLTVFVFSCRPTNGIADRVEADWRSQRSLLEVAVVLCPSRSSFCNSELGPHFNKELKKKTTQKAKKKDQTKPNNPINLTRARPDGGESGSLANKKTKNIKKLVSSSSKGLSFGYFFFCFAYRLLARRTWLASRPTDGASIATIRQQSHGRRRRRRPVTLATRSPSRHVRFQKRKKRKTRISIFF